ncbi:50S ribosomal protein L20 [Candidatus Woesebacteria bacterium RIFCSPHIGHO2_01_FULL_38_26b]|uniref:Large ribosomal subunit protein bL20 n=1 Tax=Candidatus Woesebacteria bacterium RIFCSPHIGHO2_01_FULL_38_26b TaxID=1802491 RepID=A0A1F7XYQ7_9BACT|nr:MAG: 50S ribosomal protein L20 [Candidatus Woesebacteria bacterium RIFCSPHIGHO2_01_FULL_38_26b]
MARTKSIAARRHRKILKQARGYKNSRSRRIRTAKEAVLHAGQYAYAGRKLRKRDLRSLWIIRLNAAVRTHGLSYSKFIAGLKQNKIELDRKILADIAVNHPDTFVKILQGLK